MAEISQRHGAVADSRRRDGRVFEQVGAGERYPPIQPFILAIHARQHRRCGEELEGAAHRKPLVAAVVSPLATRRVQNRHAETPAAALLERAEPIADALHEIRRATVGLGNGDNRAGNEGHCKGERVTAGQSRAKTS